MTPLILTTSRWNTAEVRDMLAAAGELRATGQRSLPQPADADPEYQLTRRNCTPCGPARRSRCQQPRHRRPAVSQPSHRRLPPVQDLPEAGRQLPDRAEPPPPHRRIAPAAVHDPVQKRYQQGNRRSQRGACCRTELNYLNAAQRRTSCTRARRRCPAGCRTRRWRPRVSARPCAGPPGMAARAGRGEAHRLPWRAPPAASARILGRAGDSPLASAGVRTGAAWWAGQAGGVTHRYPLRVPGRRSRRAGRLTGSSRNSRGLRSLSESER